MEEEFRPDWKFKVKRFYKECMRVFRITKKPSMMEFKTIVKASGLGMIVIGLIGFVISIIKQLMF